MRAGDCPHGVRSGLARTRRGEIRCPLCRQAIEPRPRGGPSSAECPHGAPTASTAAGEPMCPLCRHGVPGADHAPRPAGPRPPRCPHGVAGGVLAVDESGEPRCGACARLLAIERTRDS
jgi:hypothetical protein